MEAAEKSAKNLTASTGEDGMGVTIEEQDKTGDLIISTNLREAGETDFMGGMIPSSREEDEEDNDGAREDFG